MPNPRRVETSINQSLSLVASEQRSNEEAEEKGLRVQTTRYSRDAMAVTRHERQ